MSGKQLYTVLGVAENSTADQIKTAFRQKALQCHPDRHMDASAPEKEQLAASFKRIKDAYEILGDAQKRAVYDRLGTSSSYASSGQSSTYSQAAYRQHFYRARQSSYRRQRSRPAPGYEYVSALLRGMTRVDGMFHMAVGATLLFGLAIAGGVAEKIWEKQNEGKLYHHVQTKDMSSRSQQVHGQASDSQSGATAQHPILKGLQNLDGFQFRKPGTGASIPSAPAPGLSERAEGTPDLLKTSDPQQAAVLHAAQHAAAQTECQHAIDQPATESKSAQQELAATRKQPEVPEPQLGQQPPAEAAAPSQGPADSAAAAAPASHLSSAVAGAQSQNSENEPD